jgi:hypothetical protein
MSGIIVDGTGTSLKAKVDARHELHVRGRTVDQSALKCVDGQVFLLSIPFYTVPASAHIIAWMEFTDPLHYFVLDKLIPSWNGGGTSHNKAMRVEYLIGSTTPTAGHTAYGMANSNTLSTNQLDATVYVWNGVTEGGIAVASIGVATGRMIVGQGYTIAPVDGKMIVAPNTTLAVRVTPEEEGDVTFTGYFYLFDPTVDGE